MPESTWQIPSSLCEASLQAAHASGRAHARWIADAAEQWAADPFIAYGGANRLPAITRLEVELLAADPNQDRVDVWVALAAAEGWNVHRACFFLGKDTIDARLRRGQRILDQGGVRLADMLSRFAALPFPSDPADQVLVVADPVEVTVGWPRHLQKAFTAKAWLVGMSNDRALCQAMSDLLWAEDRGGAVCYSSRDYYTDRLAYDPALV